MALIVVALAAVMIAGTIATSADNSVFAKKHKHGKHHNDDNSKHASVNQGISRAIHSINILPFNLQGHFHQLLTQAIM